MRRMYDDKGVKLAANTPIEVPAGTNPDDLIEAGTYKIKNVDIYGTNYDGTIVVVPWDSLYFRQIFYTIDNADPNPIFTRVRVNLGSPWKAWELYSAAAYITAESTAGLFNSTPNTIKTLDLTNVKISSTTNPEIYFYLVDTANAEEYRFKMNSILDPTNTRIYYYVCMWWCYEDDYLYIIGLDVDTKKLKIYNTGITIA